MDGTRRDGAAPEGEELLAGGNASGAVVRVGDTVRKPWSPAAPSVTAYVNALRRAGVDAPALGGRDERGRQIVEYVPGALAMGAPPLTESELGRVGALVRRIHDASATFVPSADAAWDVLIPPPDAPSSAALICHNDLAPWNLVLSDRWTFIDWDGAGPSTRLWDLAHAAQAFTLNDVEAPVVEAAENLRAFVGGYGADDALRAGLPDAMGDRAAAMHELLRAAHASGLEPWGSMYADGHGAHWAAATRYVREHRRVWRDALG